MIDGWFVLVVLMIVDWIDLSGSMYIKLRVADAC